MALFSVTQLPSHTGPLQQYCLSLEKKVGFFFLLQWGKTTNMHPNRLFVSNVSALYHFGHITWSDNGLSILFYGSKNIVQFPPSPVHQCHSYHNSESVLCMCIPPGGFVLFANFCNSYFWIAVTAMWMKMRIGRATVSWAICMARFDSGYTLHHNCPDPSLVSLLNWIGWTHIFFLLYWSDCCNLNQIWKKVQIKIYFDMNASAFL